MSSIATLLAFFAVVSAGAIVSAQGYVFASDLKLGSTGSDVVALQTTLISGGFHIPFIESGSVIKGRFGSQTKKAVQQYQSAHSISATGFVGPITRKALNSNSLSEASTMFVATSTPVAMSTSVTSSTTTSLSTTTPPVVIPPAVMSTPGAVGTLAVSLWSTPSGIVAYKGQSYDVAAYKVQASASDMSIQNLTLDFDVRLWLYASAITVKDDSGAVIGSVTNLNAGNFSELTVGSQYRVSVPVSGYVVKAVQTKYLTVNITFLPTSDRTTGTVTVKQAQIRSVDGTGVTDTETAATARTFTYQGSGAAQLVATLSPANPPIGFIEISSSAPSDGAVLGIYSLKSQNQGATLRALKVNLGIWGNGNPDSTIPKMLNSIALKVGDTVVANGSLGTINGVAGDYQDTVVTFSNFSAELPADKYIDLSIVARIAQDTGHRFEGMYATTTLDLTVPANIDVEDASFVHIVPNSIALAGNSQQLTESLVSAAGMPTVTYGQLGTTQTGTTTQQFVFTVPLVAGKNAIYISKDVYTSIGTSSTPTGFTISSVNFTDSDNSGDGASYFYLAPGQAKTFTATYQATAAFGSSGAFQVTGLTYGTDTTAVGGLLYSPDISAILTANLFH